MSGPGTEAERIFRRLGIRRRSAQCRLLVQLADLRGWRWCEQNHELLTDELCRRAVQLRIPHARADVRRIILAGIRKARKRD